MKLKKVVLHKDNPQKFASVVCGQRGSLQFSYEWNAVTCSKCLRRKPAA